MTLPIITPDWPLQDKVIAFTTTRSGGVSQPPYDDFNLALHVNDKANDVLTNRDRLRAMLPPDVSIKWLKQTHSNVAVDATDIVPDEVEADAAYTDKRQIACAVLTADCLPIILADKNGDCIAAVHAGWRGVINGVIDNTIAAMCKHVQPQYAWLGPAIGADAFEVGADVYEAYLQVSSDLGSCFSVQQSSTQSTTKQTADKWKLNIYQAAKIMLKRADIENVYGGDYCTYGEADRFFSYRRQATTGRMATIVMQR